MTQFEFLVRLCLFFQRFLKRQNFNLCNFTGSVVQNHPDNPGHQQRNEQRAKHKNKLCLASARRRLLNNGRLVHFLTHNAILMTKNKAHICLYLTLPYNEAQR